MNKTDKFTQDLAEDKETLKHCLEFEPCQNLIRGELDGKVALAYIMIDKWWKRDYRVLSVAHILNRYGQFKDTSEVIDFFEKPYNFENRMRFVIEEVK